MMEEESTIITAMRAYLEGQNMRALSFELTKDGGYRLVTSPRQFSDTPDDILIIELEEIFTKVYVEKVPIVLEDYSIRAQSIKLLVEQLAILDRSISRLTNLPDGLEYMASNAIYLNLPGDHATKVRLSNLVHSHAE